MRHSYHIQSHMQPRPFDDTGTDTNTDVVCNELRVSIRADTDHGATAARSEKRYGNGELTWGDGLEGEGRRAVAAARRARGGRGRRRGGGGRGGEPLLVALVEGRGRGVVRTAELEERPQERCRPGEGRAGLGVRRQEQGPRPAAPAKDPSRQEEDWGRGG